jgi:DnaJ-domain-containing protein 1
MNLSKYLIITLALFNMRGYANRTVTFINTTDTMVALDSRSRNDWDFQRPEQIRPNEQLTYTFEAFASGFPSREEMHAIAEMRVAYYIPQQRTYTQPYAINMNTLRETIRNCQNGSVTVEILARTPRASGNEAPTRMRCTLARVSNGGNGAAIDLKESSGPYKELGVSRNATPAQILGVKEDASITEINKAWKQLSLKWHPDKARDENDLATQITQIINNARAQLLNARQ